jgi:hypothetical protein
MSERRTLGATDELYFSTPYFTSVEASRIKSTTIKKFAHDSSLETDDREPTDITSQIPISIEAGNSGGTETIE